MIPRDAWPLEPATRRALAETVADARHEWQRAETTMARTVATLRFATALMRTLAMASAQELRIVARSTIAWRWLVIGAAMALAVAMMAASPGTPPQAAGLIGGFMLTIPISVYAAAASLRRDVRVPVMGMTVLSSMVALFLILVAMPLAMPYRLARMLQEGRILLPWPLIVRYMVPCVVLSVLALLVAERARTEARRGVILLAGFLSPIAAIAVDRQLHVALAGYWLRGPALSYVAELLLCIALPLLTLWLVLVRRSSRKGALA